MLKGLAEISRSSLARSEEALTEARAPPDEVAGKAPRWGHWMDYGRPANSRYGLRRFDLREAAMSREFSAQRTPLTIIQGMLTDVISPKARAFEAEKASIAGQIAAAHDTGKTISICPAAMKNSLKHVAASAAGVGRNDRGSPSSTSAPFKSTA
jgi:hypothetical protein